MTIIISCAVIAILIIVALVIINLRSNNSNETAPRKEKAPAAKGPVEKSGSDAVDQMLSKAAAEVAAETPVQNRQEAVISPPVPTATAENAAPAQVQPEPQVRPAPVISEPIVPAAEERKPDVQSAPVIPQESEDKTIVDASTSAASSSSLDQDFREGLRRLKEQPVPKAMNAQIKEKIADDAYRRALKSFKDKPKNS